MGGRELAQRLEEEYATTAKSGTPSHIAAMDRIRKKSPFRKTIWHGWVKRISQNPKGQMEVMFIIPYEQRAEVLELVNAYGMPLDIYIQLFGEEEPKEYDNPDLDLIPEPMDDSEQEAIDRANKWLLEN
jgi:hypothetical protein